MLLSRHFVIMVVSVVCIGAVFWWQRPDTAVSAMAGGQYSSNSYSVVKNYFKRMDYRQFDLTEKMTAATAKEESAALQKQLEDNPFLSIQSVDIKNINNNTFLVKIYLGSAIDEKRQITYEVKVISNEEGYLITNIRVIS